MTDARPNIIVIYTDDQGYGDVSALNPKAKFQTPNLDRLAREGICFTNGHCADSVCTPSRYGLLTGRYCWRTSRKRGVMGAEGPCLIEDRRMTIASLLRDQGYHTGMVGKWHLGMTVPGSKGERNWSLPITDMPLDKGFDYFFGIPASMNFGVLAWFEGRYAKVPPTLYTRKKPNDRHVDFRIMPPYEAAPQDRHDIEIAPDFDDTQCLTRFTDKAIEWLQGRADDAKSGTPFFLYLPLTSPHYPVCPLPEFYGAGEAGGYGEFVVETDHHVGRILDFLKAAELDDNTLVIFTSDNGPESSWAWRIDEYGHDSRGSFREGKRSAYEGGHRIPFLVRWPNGIAGPGRSWDQTVGQTDLLATFAELVGAHLPDDAGEDSQSFASVLRGSSTHSRAPLINHGESPLRYTITDGTWKLVLPGADTPAELYDLAQDPGETHNVAIEQPQIREALTTKITAIVINGRTTVGAPQPNDTGYWNDLTWIDEETYSQKNSDRNMNRKAD